MGYARLVWFFVLMGVFAATYQAGAMTDMPEEEAEAILAEFESLTEGIDAVGIFLHNTTIAMTMFIPGLGLALGLFSAWMTGVVFSAISTGLATAGQPDAIMQPLFLLFLTPFGLMEVCAYSIAMSRSLLMTFTIIRRGAISWHLKPLLAEVGIVAALLLAGGYVEFFLIENAVGFGAMSTTATATGG